MSQISSAHTLETLGDPSRTVALLVVALFLLVSPFSPLIRPVSSDPGFVDNGDDTRSFVWNFTESADYDFVNTSISGGLGTLNYVNESMTDSTAAMFDQGTKTNIDSTTFPDSLAIADASVPVTNTVIQFGLDEGEDLRVEYEWPSWNTEGGILTIDSEIGRELRVFIRFNLSSIPANAVITNASMGLYMSSGATQVVDFGVYTLNSSWNVTSASWARIDATHYWSNPGGDHSAEAFFRGSFEDRAGWHMMDVSRLVDLWVRNEIPNNGVVLVPVPQAGNAEKNFISTHDKNDPEKRPKLVINYTMGQAAGVFESRVLGAGTNATFDYASWTASSTSLANDDFLGPALSPKWKWMNDPTVSGGSYDFGTPDLLRIEGSPSTNLDNMTITCNLLYQTVAGDFNATLDIQEQFFATSMSAGLLVYGDSCSWVALVKTGFGAGGSIRAIASQGGVSSVLGQVGWAASSTADLMVEKSHSAMVLKASMDGENWTLIATYSYTYGFMERVRVGPCIFSGGSALKPIAYFDSIMITPIGQTPQVEIRVRTGNSTLLSDPSWGAWGLPMAPSTGASFSLTGRYLQYQATLATDWGWLSPLFSSFTCYETRFLDVGIITTNEVAPIDLQAWQWLNVTQYVENGSVEYLYSSDHGGSWVSLGFGSTLALTTTEPSLMIRMILRSYDTVVSPTIDSIVATYAVSVSYFSITTFATVTSGVPFSVTVQARDSSGNVATSWNGDVTLHALDASGTSDASSELYTTVVTLIAGELIFNQRYDIAEVIRLSAHAGGAWGLSAQVSVQPGGIASIVILPGDSTMLEHTSLSLNAQAYDAQGNPVPSAFFSWAAEESLGVLSANSGATVVLSVGEYDTGGVLSVTSAGVTAYRTIQVLPSRFAPNFDDVIPDQVKPEDFGIWTLDIADLVSDPEDMDSMLRWYTTNESLVQVSGENRTGNLVITFSTITNLFGTNKLDLFVVDSDGMRSSASIYVEIESENDAPSIAHVDPLVVHQAIDYVFDFTHYINDPDDPPEELVMTADEPSRPYVTVDGFVATFNYPSSMIGTEQSVIFMITDDSDASATSKVMISVTDDFVPTQLEQLPHIILDQGSSRIDYIYLPTYFSDPEGDVLYYASGNAHVTIDIKDTDYVDIIAPEDWYGDEYIIIQATDPDGARVEGVLHVTVMWVDKPPEMRQVPDLAVHHDERYEFDLYPYVYDPDDSIEDLVLSSNDTHCTFMGATMVVLYPISMLGSVNPVRIAVAEESVTASCVINITVTDNSPPKTRPGYPLPDHSFQEDLEIDYPKTQGLDYYFTDVEDLQNLEFVAFALSTEVTANASENLVGNWKVQFAADQDYYGNFQLVIRAIDSEGGIIEEMISVEVVPVPDSPSIDLPVAFGVVEGEQTILNLREYVTDPDSSFEKGELTFEFRVVSVLTNGEDYELSISLLPGALVFQYPKGFLQDHVNEFVIEITVTDQTDRISRDDLRISISEAPVAGPTDNPSFLWAVVVAIAGGSAGMIGVAWMRRREPFIVRDLMLIHNDGFLISRYAQHHEGEIDENIMSGMLTAVLGFVEDSMNSQHDDLKSFGFKDYRVAVERGEKCFAAVVYDGDAPENLVKQLQEFLGTVERIYRKKLVQWTGDIDTDFAGMDVLIGAWVKDNSKKGRRDDSSVWKTREEKQQRAVRPKKVEVDMISGEQKPVEIESLDDKNL